MKVAYKLLLGLALLQGAAYAADEPKIEVIDGKISVTAQAVPLGRFLAMFDKALGLKSEVKPGLENRNMSVQFTGLNFNDAVRKIFQGQPYNYMVIHGKGIRVTDLAVGGGASSVVDSQPFNNSSQPFNAPLQPVQQIVNPNQPGASIFGGAAPANTNPGPANPVAPLSGPGLMPPPIGASNPLIAPIGGPNSGGNVGGGGFPGAGTPAPAQPPAPGTLPGVTPGAAPGTIK